MSDQPPPDKPTFRVPAGSSREGAGWMTHDNISNFMARVGISQPNQLAASTYNYHPISRIATMMEWAYRGSWIVGAAVDIVADDMTRMGVHMNTETPPDDLDRVAQEIHNLELWQSLNETIKWARLYGGCIMAMQIDGQDMATPLDPESVGEGALKGFMVIDRWMITPSFRDVITELGPDYGLPIYYDMMATAPFLPAQRIHYTRVVRMDGLSLPFRQKIGENGWGMSVVERLYDRLVAFDSGTMGAAQLLFKAYLRTYKVKDYRMLLGAGGELHEKFAKQMDLMRMLQSNEGLTVIDAEDDFQTHSYSFGGIPETLLILGQQISGALGIPLTRLFGQSPSGMNSTGESDLRNYYDLVRATQEARLRRPLTRVFRVIWQSVLGTAPPDTWDFAFTSLRQLDEMEKAQLAQIDAATVASLHDAGIISTTIALKELKQQSIRTGRFTNISDEDIKDSEEAPPPWEQPDPSEMMPGMSPIPGAPGAKPSSAGGGKPPAMPKPPAPPKPAPSKDAAPTPDL